MISRRTLLTRTGLLATALGGVWLVRDRIPWPAPEIQLRDDRPTPWLPMPPAGGLIEVTVTVMGTLLRAIVDSGAQMSAIDAALAERLRLPRNFAAPMLAYGVSGKPDLTHSVRLNLDLPGLSIRGLHTAALDLAGVSDLSGREFQMLIGRDILRHLAVEADFPAARARFLPSGAYAPPRDALELPLQSRNGAALVSIRVEASKPLEVLVDTGSSGLLALTEAAAGRSGLLAPGRAQGAAHSVNIGGLSRNRVVTARSVTVGDLVLPSVNVQIYQPAVGLGGHDGLLGSGLFRQYRTVLDLGGKRLLLVPPSLRVVSRPGAVRGGR